MVKNVKNFLRFSYQMLNDPEHTTEVRTGQSIPIEGCVSSTVIGGS